MAGTLNVVTVTESGTGLYMQRIQAGRHVLLADEPKSSGGGDTGPSPYDYLLAGLGACTAMQLRWYAHRNNLALSRATVELRHEAIHAGNGARLDHFHRMIHLEGDLTEDQRLELLQAARQCPVSQTLQNSSIVETRLAAAVPAPATGESSAPSQETLPLFKETA